MIWFKPRKAKNTNSLCINWKELGGLKIYPKMGLKPNKVRCWYQKMDVFYLIVELAERKKELRKKKRKKERKERKKKKEKKREKCMWGVWREKVTGFRWKHITHLRVLMTSCCSLPSGLGGEGPTPCCHM